MGPVRRATKARVASIDAPDVALVALAYRLADMLDDPETATASAAKEYRVTITQIAATDTKSPTVYDIDDGD